MSLLLLFRTATAAANDAEGVNGTTVDTTNSGYGTNNPWTSVTIGTGATCVYDNTAVAHGSSAIRIATSGTAAQVFATWLGPLPSHGRDYGRFYFRMASGGAARTLMRSRSGGSQVARVALTAADKLELRNGGNSSVAVGTTTLSANTWYRVEWDIQPGTGTDGYLYLYAGDSTTPLETVSANSTYGGVSTVDEHAFGQVVATASLANLWLDGMQANSTGLPGPATGVAYVETQSSANSAGATITTSASVPSGATGFATLSAVPTTATLAAASGWTVANAAQAQSTQFQVESYSATSVAASTAYAFNKDTGTRYTVTATVVSGAQTTLGGTGQAVRASAASHTTPSLTAHAGALLVATFAARVFSSDTPSMNTWTLDATSVAAGWVKQAEVVGSDGSTNTRHLVATLAATADTTVTCSATLATAEPAIVNIAEHRALTSSTQQGAATLTAAPALTAAGTGGAVAAAALTVTPTLTAAATVEAAAAAALTAAPTLAAAGTVGAVAAAALTTAPALTASATVDAAAATALTATPTLNAAATVQAVAAATLTAGPTLAAAATVTAVAAATLTATPALTGAASVTAPASANLTAAPTLTAAGTREQPAAAALTTAPTLTAAAVQTAPATASLTATPTLTAAGTRDQPATASLTAAPTFTALGDNDGAATLAATPTLTAAATRTQPAAVTLTATPTVTATGIQTTAGATALTATATLTVAAQSTGDAAAALAAGPAVTVTATRSVEALAVLLAAPTMTLSGLADVRAAAAFTAASALTLSGIANATATAQLLAVAQLVVSANTGGADLPSGIRVATATRPVRLVTLTRQECP